MPPQDTEQARWFATEVQPHRPALRAWLLARFPTLRVVFSANPNAASTPQGTYAEVLAVAREAGWLDGVAALRDYYVAHSAGVGLVWIYRERLTPNPGEDHAPWYLHGLFA